MTGLFRKLFKNPNKALLLRAFTAAVTVAGCLAAMAFTVYAYFADCVSSSSNTIQSATFTVTLTVATEDGTYSCVPLDAYTHNLSFTPGDYTVTLARSGQSTASTGYCKITVGGSEHFTQQFDAGDPALTFTLQLSEDLQLTVSSRWGTYANFNSADPTEDPYIIDGAVLDLRTEVTEPVEPDPTDDEPTDAPTEEPTDAPAEKPTEEPTEEATDAPAEEPTEEPTEEATDAPAEAPTEAPTEEAAEASTEAPTEEAAEASTETVVTDGAPI